MNKIKELRESKNITQEDLASKLGYSRTMITKWETDKLEPTIGQKIDICDVLGVPREYLDITNKIPSVKERYTKHYSNLNKSLIAGAIEDGLYLIVCLVLVIVNKYSPISHFTIIISILLSIGIFGGITIPFLLRSNAKKVKDGQKMKEWFIKSNTSKKNLKEVIKNKSVDEEFNSILLN